MAKDEVSTLHSKEGKDKEAMEEDYQKTMELIFTYGYVVVHSNTSVGTNQRF